ncbi:MAG: hypothetical protein ACPHCV_02660, partial [Pseudohongiellaceae bacterium]
TIAYNTHAEQENADQAYTTVPRFSPRGPPEDFSAVTFRPQPRRTGRCWRAENGARARHYRRVVPIDN